MSAGLSGIWQTGIWSLGWFVSGWMIGVFSNLINVKMTVGVEKEYLGRAAALFNSAGCAAAPAVSLGVAGLLQATGLVPLTAGCLAVSAALLLWMAGRKDCNLLDEQI